MNSIRERDNYIDIIKGIGIVCIVLLHFEDGILPTSIDTWISYFMVSIFYFCSGWLIDANNKYRTISELLKRKWKSLCIPYLWFSLIIIVFDFILLFFNIYDTKYILKEIYKFLTLRGIGTLWFLPALLGGEVIWIWLKKENRFTKLLILILTLSYIQLYHIIFDDKYTDLWHIINAPFRTLYNILSAWIPIAIGFYTHHYCSIHITQMKNKFFYGSIAIIIGFFLCNYGQFPSFNLTYFLWPIFSYIGLLLLAMQFRDTLICKYFNYWGLNSLILMVTHYSIFLELCKCLNKFLFDPPDWELHGWTSLLFFSFTMIIEHPTCLFINTKAKFLIGR